MSIRLEYLPEPNLQFGEYFEHEDTKTGLAEFGPFGKNVPGLHPAEIKLGFVGTRETVSDAKEWITACGGGDRERKHQRRDSWAAKSCNRAFSRSW